MDVTQATRSGSRVEGGAEARSASAREWHEAREAERFELARERISGMSAAAWLGLLTATVLAGLLPAIYPLSPGYPSTNTVAQVVGAAVAAAAAVGVIPLARDEVRSRGLSPGGWQAVVLYAVALLSVGAAAIHFAVAKMHFDEYTLFGVFFVISGIAQLGWALLVLAWPVRRLLGLGALGNASIVALWGVDRIWGLPLGPEHWKPDPIGFGDVAASAFELLLVLGCLALLRRRASPPTDGRLPSRRWPLVLTAAVAALTALSLLSAMAIGSPVITPSM